MKTRRVGSISCGVLLVVFGILFIIKIFVPFISYANIMRFWPVILISLGVEMLLSNRKTSEGMVIKYDGWAVLITILLFFFAVGMGIAEYCMQYVPGCVAF